MPVGREIGKLEQREPETGSIIAVVATDAPLLPHQLKRLARRAPLGVARMGGVGGNGSGDIFLAFSTYNAGAARRTGLADIKMLPNDQMDGLSAATVEATEEAIVNALTAAETMTGRDGVTIHALPHERLREILRAYGRLETTLKIRTHHAPHKRAKYRRVLKCPMLLPLTFALTCSW